MQSFLNSPPGPLGGAGQTGTSTTPQNIFNNAGGLGNRFGAGMERFKNHMGAFSEQARDNPLNSVQGMFKPGGLLGNLFGGDGGMLGGMFGSKGLGGIPQAMGQIPQNLGSIFSRGGQGQQPQGVAPTGAPPGGGNPFGGGSGFLSRFMGGNNGQV